MKANKLIPALVALIMVFSAFSGCKNPGTPADALETPEFTITGEGNNSKYINENMQYGYMNRVQLKYHLGEKGLYFAANVTDEEIYIADDDFFENSKSNAMEKSDRIEFFIYTGDVTPNTIDSKTYRIRITPEGIYDVANGDKGWKITDKKLDAVKTVILDNEDDEPSLITYVPQIPEEGDEPQDTELEPDGGYKIECFISFRNFGFTKANVYYVSFGHSDILGPQSFESVFSNADGNALMDPYSNFGSITNPQQFMPLSVYGFGTAAALEAEIDGVLDDEIWAQEGSETFINNKINRSDRFTTGAALTSFKYKYGDGYAKGMMYSGSSGIYIGVEISAAVYLEYYDYSTFRYNHEHVEIRIDTNNDKLSDDGDCFFYTDIMGYSANQRGIINEGRKIANWAHMYNIRYKGEIRDKDGARKIKALSKDSDDGKAGYVFEMFIPYSAMGVSSGNKIGVFVSAGNPMYSTSYGCVIGQYDNRAGSAEFDSYYNNYSKYQEIVCS